MAHFSALADGPLLPRQMTGAAVFPRSHHLSFPATEAAVPVVRHTVMGILRSWGLPGRSEAAEAVEVVVSELVTNAVQHTRGGTSWVTVTLQVRADGLLRLGVGDDAPGVPAARRVSADAENGRGLAIAEILAAELDGTITVERQAGGGKTLWAHFPGLLAPREKALRPVAASALF